MAIYLQYVLAREFKAKGISLNKAAKACKIPPSVLHGWLNGILPSAKNLHHIKALSEYLDVPVSELLFKSVSESAERSVLFSSEFEDGKTRYRISVEKIKK